MTCPARGVIGNGLRSGATGCYGPAMTDHPSALKRSGSPQSVTRVIRIIEELCARPGPVSLADLSRVLGAPKSSMAALLRGLADEGFVTATDGAWVLGPGAYGLGGALNEARRRVQSSDLVRDGMRRLADACGETVLFGVLDRDNDVMTYVDVVESRNPLRFAVAAGDRRALHCTAGGRALLATWPDADIARYLDKLANPAAPDTDIDTLSGAIADIRVSGVAQTRDQAVDGVTGTASVIRSAGGAVAGALIIGAPTERAQGRMDELARLAKASASSISASLGHRAG